MKTVLAFIILILVALTAPAQVSDPAASARNAIDTAKVWVSQASDAMATAFAAKDAQNAQLQSEKAQLQADKVELQAKLDAALAASSAPDPVISKIKSLPGTYDQMALVTAGPTISYWFPAPGGDRSTPPQQVCFAAEVPVVVTP